MRRLMLVVVAVLSAASANAQKPIRIAIETSLGTIEAELDSARAPVTVTNFLRYLDAGMYEGGSFFRAVTMATQPNDSVKIEVIQGGASKEKRGTGFPAVPLERTSVTGLHHGDGVLSMARGGPDSATDQFFVVIGEQPALDFGGHRNLDGQGFAAFGRVTRGMDIVRSIQGQAVRAQTLVTPVQILRVYRR